jgi:NAD(P) transhydrogenase subunit alpha
MHSKNVITLFRHIYSDDTEGIDLEDEIVKGVCITHNGEIINEMVKKNFDKESAS